MQKELQVRINADIAANKAVLTAYVSKKMQVPIADITHIQILRRSIDARRNPVKINLNIRVYLGEDYTAEVQKPPEGSNVDNAPPVVIVGAGPAGLFAAIKCIENGVKPIVLERGKDVRRRRRDLKAINIEHKVDENSNYCFLEGGAGTYSDGKLYTRSKKRGDVRAVLNLLVAFGAQPDILIDAHPHIGTNKLPGIISTIRNYILDHGGQILFETKISELILSSGSIRGVRTEGGESVEANQVILATGHSARDIYEMLHRQGVEISAKPFAFGVRVEHPQTLIDRIQYHCPERGPYLPPAPYNIVRQVAGRGVYSFCMCPGGIIAPCATSPGEVVTNGWSPSRRDQKTANSGIVVELRPEDFNQFEKHGPLAAMEFQRFFEQKAWQAAGRTQRVPAQRLTDFVKGRASKSLPVTSYKPGVTSIELGTVLPEFVYKSLQHGFKLFGKSMHGFLTNEAVVHAPESRTSSPVRIPRDPETLQHIAIEGLYPCGEGAGYAGGIISAAIDGIKCAEKCVKSMHG